MHPVLLSGTAQFQPYSGICVLILLDMPWGSDFSETWLHRMLCLISLQETQVVETEICIKGRESTYLWSSVSVLQIDTTCSECLPFVWGCMIVSPQKKNLRLFWGADSLFCKMWCRESSDASGVDKFFKSLEEQALKEGLLWKKTPNTKKQKATTPKNPKTKTHKKTL